MAERSSAVERLIRLLVLFFPPSFRRTYGRALLQTYRDELRDVRARPAQARLAYGVSTVAVLLRDAVLEWATVLRARRMRGDAHRGLMTGLSVDARHALRSMYRSPAFALTVIVTLGLGVAATTSIFSVFDGILLRPLPYPSPSELYQVGVSFGTASFDANSAPNIRDLRAASGGIRIAAARVESRVLLHDGRPRAISVQAVSPDFLDILGATPVLGRAFVADDDRRESIPTAIVSDGFWRDGLGGAADVLGRTLRLDGTGFTIVGVAPRGFRSPEAISGEVDVWVPMAHAAGPVDDRGSFGFSTIARVPPDQTIERARATLNAIAARLTAAYPDDNTFQGQPMTFWLRDLYGQTVGDARSSLGVLMAAVGLLLLITCANVAGLMLVRALDRERDIAVCGALGASRGRLIREQIVGAVALAVPSGLLGGVLAFAGVAAFRAMGPADLPRLDEVSVDWRAFAFALGITVLAGLLVGAAPALRVLRRGGGDALRTGNRGGTERPGAALARSTLVVVETALALVLLVGSGLLVNSLIRLNGMNPGFVVEGLLVVDLQLGTVLAEDPAFVTFQREITERVRALPGVKGVTTATSAPLSDTGAWSTIAAEGHTYDEAARVPFVRVTAVGESYASTLGVSIVEGRDLNASDRAPAGGVLVNEAFARAYWPAGPVLGRTLKFGDPANERPWLPVVGILADVRQRGLATASEPEVYLPFERRPRDRLMLLVRSAGREDALIPAIRAAIWEVQPDLPVDRVVRMEQMRSTTIAQPRFQAMLMTAFAALALLLAGVGLYGSLAWAVARRTRELGIRKALGAAHGDLLGAVMRRGMAHAALGLAFGLAASLAAGRALDSALFGIRPTDPVTLAAAGAALAMVAALACYLPARRAARIEPVESLRSD